jgi:hypothetical protein
MPITITGAAIKIIFPLWTWMGKLSSPSIYRRGCGRGHLSEYDKLPEKAFVKNKAMFLL